MTLRTRRRMILRNGQRTKVSISKRRSFAIPGPLALKLEIHRDLRRGAANTTGHGWTRAIEMRASLLMNDAHVNPSTSVHFRLRDLTIHHVSPEINGLVTRNFSLEILPGDLTMNR